MGSSNLRLDEAAVDCQPVTSDRCAACWREFTPPTASNKLVRLATAPIMTATQFPPRQGRTGADRCWPGDCVAISRRANVGGDVRRVAHSERGRGLMNRLARTLLVV